jgi:hypothetical protein
MRNWKQVTVVALCAGALFVGQAISQDKTAQPAPGEPGGAMPDMQAMMQKWMARQLARLLPTKMETIARSATDAAGWPLQRFVM